MKEQCRICGKHGIVGEEIIITGSRYAVHAGECHDELIRIDKNRRNNNIDNTS